MSSATLNFVLAHPNEAADRIEALEAALRKIAEGSFVSGTIYDGIRIARAALAPEQDT